MEQVRQYLATIHQKSHLNVFLSVYQDEAIRRAEEIDQKIKEGKAGRLAGMVVGLKDVISYAGHPLQSSSKILDGYIAPFNATVVDRLLKEDAIIMGRQNCDEFAMGSSNENSAFGSTLNEIDTERVPGGSSGASAVAVMADMCHVSLGSDTGGSVRQPAAFCGVIGFKPTYSRLSRYGLVAYASSFDCIGVLANHLEDIALVMDVISGSDEYDSTVTHRPVPSYSEQLTKSNSKKYKVAYIRETLRGNGLQPEIRESIQRRLDALAADGHQVTGIDFPMMDYLLPTYYILATAEASSNLSRYDGVRYGYRSKNTASLETLYKKTRAEGLGDEVQRRILLGTFVLSASYYDAYYTKAQKVRRLIREQTKSVFKEHDFIISPTTPTTAFKLGEHTHDPIEMYLSDIYSVHANVAGIPALSLPCGHDTSGLPIGLQIMANDFEESKLFQFSKELLNLEQTIHT